MAGIRYDVSYDPSAEASSVNGLSTIAVADPDIKQYAKISGGRSPVLVDLSAIDEYRTEESKVPAGSFLIVDTTGATYGKVQEDTRKGISCECIGIVPVVTTAANAIYAQQLIQAGLGEISAFETLGGTALKTLVAKDLEGNELSNSGLLASDLDKLLNTNGYYQFIDEETFVYTFTSYQPISVGIDEVAADAEYFMAEGYKDTPALSSYEDRIEAIVQVGGEDIPISSLLVSSDLGPADIEDAGVDLSSMSDYVKWTLPTNVTCKLLKTDPRYGWHNPQGDDSIPDTLALDANNWFAAIQPAEDGEGFDPTHLKDVGVVVYKMYLDTSAGSKVSYEPVEAFCGSLCKDDKDPETKVTKFLDTVINS